MNKPINIVKNVVRLQSTVNSFEISSNFVNRNPRNLEKLRIGYKPDGYHLEAPGKIYWNKLELNEGKRYVIATVSHFREGEIVKASTSEWAIKKRLYRYNDVSAYMNLGRVLAERCLRAGITEMSCFVEIRNPEGRAASFLRAVKDCGVILKEPEQFKPVRPWDQLRPEKPWEVLD